MIPLNLRAYDLNLLPILDALLDEQSVSLAAERVNLSQSATSSALTRLREMMKDPILVRRGQRMMPSPGALLIRDQLKGHLAGITEVIAQMRAIASDGQRHQVTLCAPEHIQLTLIDAFRGLMRERAADADIKILTLDHGDMIAHLEQRKADIAIGSFASLSETFRRRKLYRETMIAVLRNDHPALARAIDGRMTLQDFTSLSHLVVSTSENVADSQLGKWLLSKAVPRKVAAVVEHISMVTELLRDSDAICLGSVRSFAVTPDGDRHLTHLRLPVEMTPDAYFVEMIWHDRTEQDEVLRDFRRAIVAYCQEEMTAR